MIKSHEISNPTSCLNKAADDEPIFVLRAKDPIAAAVVRLWASLSSHSLNGGPPAHEARKTFEAYTISCQMDDWRRTREVTGG